ncbi:unnamed protein product, partial [Phaeothamnion confervicola]
EHEAHYIIISAATVGILFAIWQFTLVDAIKLQSGDEETHALNSVDSARTKRLREA